MTPPGGPSPKKQSIHRNGYKADIITSGSPQGTIYHYVIQPVGSTEIVHWGQELSLDDAVASIDDFFEQHMRKSA